MTSSHPGTTKGVPAKCSPCPWGSGLRGPLLASGDTVLGTRPGLAFSTNSPYHQGAHTLRTAEATTHKPCYLPTHAHATNDINACRKRSRPQRWHRQRCHDTRG